MACCTPFYADRRIKLFEDKILWSSSVCDPRSYTSAKAPVGAGAFVFVGWDQRWIRSLLVFFGPCPFVLRLKQIKPRLAA